MVTDLQLADLCIALYNAGMGQFDHVETTSGVCWGFKKEPDCSVIILRGSTTFRDWVRDFMALTSPLWGGEFGPVHPGFWLGMWETFQRIRGLSEGPYVICGHSLGAGRAAILSALMVAQSHKVIRRVGFGEPKPGFGQLASYIRSVPAAIYRNGDNHHHDLITDVPLAFPPEDYVHSAELTHICSQPAPGDEWGPFAYHHMQLYRAALAQ